MSAPSANGSWRPGGPNVESIIRYAPRLCASSADRRILSASPVGLIGVSRWITSLLRERPVGRSPGPHSRLAVGVDLLPEGCRSIHRRWLCVSV